VSDLVGFALPRANFSALVLHVQVGVRQDMGGFLQHFLQAGSVKWIILLIPPMAV
jgi:hypothetical protein